MNPHFRVFVLGILALVSGTVGASALGGSVAPRPTLAATATK